MLQSHITLLMNELETKRNDVEKVTKEADEIREMQQNFRVMVYVRSFLPFLSPSLFLLISLPETNSEKQRIKWMRFKKGY